MSTSTAPSGKRKREASEELSASLRSTPGLPLLDLGDFESEEDEADDDVDTDIDGQNGYNAFHEAFPTHPAFDDDLNGTVGAAMDLVKQIQELLITQSSRSETLQTMQRKAAACREGPQCKRPVIGLVGDTGDGKSSLINSLTDVPGLARTGATGSSCTNVPTVYRGPLPGQTKLFAGKAWYHNHEELQTFLGALLSNYKRYVQTDLEDCDIYERSDIEMLGETAMQTFLALFRDKPGFASEKAAKLTLENALRRDLPILDTMVRQCESSLEHLEGNEKGHFRFFEADTATGLDEALSPITTDGQTAETVSLWPLVSEVDIGVDPSVSRLLRSVTMVDLPGENQCRGNAKTAPDSAIGTTDTNTVRGNAAFEYMKKCHAFWYVADIKRAIDNRNLESTVRKYAERFPNTFAIVITEVDHDIDASLAEHMRAAGQDMSDYDERTQNLTVLSARMAKAERSVNALPPLDSQRLRKMQFLGLLKEHVNATENAHFGCIVGARTKHNKSQLLAGKQKHFPAGCDLQVFGVSNEHYTLHKKRARARRPLLTAEATGIPALRDYTLRLAAPGLWKAAQELIESNVGVLIQSLHLWTENRIVEHRDSLLEIARSLQSDGKAHFADISKKQNETFETHLLKPLRHKLKASQKAGLEELNALKDWNAASFLAFYRNGGNYYTPTMGSHAWNEKFTSHQTEKVFSPGWYAMLPLQEELLSTPAKTIVKQVENLPVKVNNSPIGFALDPSTLSNMIKGHVTGIEANYERIRDEYKQDLANIKIDATLDRRASYFTKAMKPAYAFGHDAGAGVRFRVTQRLQSHLQLPTHGEGSPWTIALNDLSVDLSQISMEQKLRLSEQIETRLQDIYEQFEALTRQKPETSQERMARKDIRAFFATAMPKWKEVESRLQVIREKYAAE